MPDSARLPALAVLVAACTGCLPVIAHGPRVEPGTSIGLTASLTKGPGDLGGDEETPFLLGPLGVNLGAGWGGGRPGEPGARVGLHVPLPLVLLPQGDVYVQLPAGTLGALDGGIGLSALLVQPSAMTMPYLQLGRISEGGSGWYTTQGVLLQSEDAIDLWGETVGAAWMPALAYQGRRGDDARVPPARAPAAGGQALSGARPTWRGAGGGVECGMRNEVLMRPVLAIAACGLALLAAAPACAQESGAPRVPLSQRGTVTQRVGTTDIAISYNRPVARGRALFGALVPWRREWNPGADTATSISVSAPVRVNGEPLAAGSYSLWAIPDTASWTIIFSGAQPVWHRPYPAGRDVLRVRATPATGEHMETLAFYFPVVGPDSAVLRLHWGTTVVPVTIRTDAPAR